MYVCMYVCMYVPFFVVDIFTTVDVLWSWSLNGDASVSPTHVTVVDAILNSADPAVDALFCNTVP